MVGAESGAEGFFLDIQQVLRDLTVRKADPCLPPACRQDRQVPLAETRAGGN